MLVAHVAGQRAAQRLWTQTSLATQRVESDGVHPTHRFVAPSQRRCFGSQAPQSAEVAQATVGLPCGSTGHSSADGTQSPKFVHFWPAGHWRPPAAGPHATHTRPATSQTVLPPLQPPH
ncbi:MAG: hypothetical protein IPG50_28785 [Myxococcales bacterium]|nr:hypothetical protein [Myxococcales bacterium]